MNRAASFLRAAWNLMGRSPFTVSQQRAPKGYAFFSVGVEDASPALFGDEVSLGEIPCRMSAETRPAVLHTPRDVRRATVAPARTTAARRMLPVGTRGMR